MSGIPLPAPTASQISLQITGMTCAACVSHVSDALLSVDGVEDVAVNLATEKATISLGESNRQSDSPVDLGILGDALKDAGYGVGTRKVTLGIDGMTCAACVSHVENALTGVQGVESASVNLATERATVEYVQGVTGIADLRHAVEDSGYSATALVGDEMDEDSAHRRLGLLKVKFAFSLASCRRHHGAHGDADRAHSPPVQNGVRASRSGDPGAALGRFGVLHVGVERGAALHVEHEHTYRGWYLSRLCVQRSCNPLWGIVVL